MAKGQRTLEQFLKSKSSPVLVYLELAHRCSFHCIHCYIPEDDRHPRQPSKLAAGMSTEEVKALLDELAAAGTLFLVFTGGEIFLRADLFDLTAYARKLGFVVKYFTNGFHITPKGAQRIAELGVYAVEISLYGANDQTYEMVTGIKGGFTKVEQSVKLLHEQGVRLILKTPALRQTIAEIPFMQAFARSYGASFRFDLLLIPRFNGDKQPLAHAVSDEQIIKLYEELGANFASRVKQDAKPTTCSVGRWSAIIAPDGEIYPCIELRQSIGNVKKQPFRQIWRDSFLMKYLRRQLDQIPQHEAFADGLCSHCPASSLRATGSLCKPGPDQERLAALKRRYC